MFDLITGIYETDGTDIRTKNISAVPKRGKRFFRSNVFPELSGAQDISVLFLIHPINLIRFPALELMTVIHKTELSN